MDGSIDSITIEKLKDDVDGAFTVNVNTLLLNEALIYAESMSSSGESGLTLLESVVVNLLDTVLENATEVGAESVSLDEADKDLVEYFTHLKMTSSHLKKNSSPYRTERKRVKQAIEERFLDIQNAIVNFFDGKLFIDFEVLGTRTVQTKDSEEAEVDAKLPIVRVTVNSEKIFDLIAAGCKRYLSQRSVLSKVYARFRRLLGK